MNATLLMQTLTASFTHTQQQRTHTRLAFTQKKRQKRRSRRIFLHHFVEEKQEARVTGIEII